MNKLTPMLRLLILTAFCHVVSAAAATVTVFAAASLTDSLKQIAVGYEKQTGDQVVFNFGASSFLARQIEEGAPADIFFSADEATQKLVWYSTGSKAVTVNLLHGSNESFTLTNASGRSLQQGHLSNGKLYLSNMAAGVYIVKVFTANGTQLNAKLILQ